MERRINQYVITVGEETYFINRNNHTADDAVALWRAVHVWAPRTDAERARVHEGASYVVDLLLAAGTLDEAQAACERRQAEREREAGHVAA